MAKGTIERFEIVVLSLNVQKNVVEKLRKFGEQIKEAQQQMANAASIKQAILDKYLK